MTFTAHCGTMGTVKETYTITTERKETKMNKEERPTMPGIVAVTKYLVDIWRDSKCPDMYEYLFECKKCKYNELCAKLDELSEVVK